MLTAVLHGLRAQRKRFVLIMTDVKSAFNHTPTAYMDQRYEGLGIPHDLQITEVPPPFFFLESSFINHSMQRRPALARRPLQGP